jgi:hypothetical protein
MMFARCGVRILNLLGCLLLAAMFSSNAYTAPKWDTEKSAKAFEEALQQKSQIEASPQSTRDQYLKCAKTFRKVHLSDPHYRHTGDAIYEEALVYQKMGEKFGNSTDFATALKSVRSPCFELPRYIRIFLKMRLRPRTLTKSFGPATNILKHLFS